MQTSINITPAEFQTRAAKLLDHIRAQGLSGVVLFDNYYILYFTGFAFIPTERPIAFVMNAQGERAMFVPRLEVEHAKSKTGFQRVDHYVEYPFDPHPMQVLKKTLADMGIRGKLGADSDGYPWILGYRGPALSELTGATVVRVTSFIEDLMMIKSEAEIALIRESVKWGNLAHRLLQRYTRVGATETEVSLRASHEATLAMLDTLGPLYRAQSMFWEGAARAIAGRSGATPRSRTRSPTTSPSSRRRAGDRRGRADVGLQLGTGTDDDHRPAFRRTAPDVRAHEASCKRSAFDALRPGAQCADVDRAVRKYYEDNDLMRYWKHHSGHAIGLRYHEGPFLDLGDHTEIEPGMVFTVEPGLYAAHLGGFRHSDTVVVTQDGIEILTYYPRDLDSLIIPV